MCSEITNRPCPWNGAVAKGNPAEKTCADCYWWTRNQHNGAIGLCGAKLPLWAERLSHCSVMGGHEGATHCGCFVAKEQGR